MRRRLALLVLAAGCRPPPATPPTSPPTTASLPAEVAPYRYGDIAGAIGVEEGIEAGLIQDGDTLDFVVEDGDTGEPLPGATLRIGLGPGARVLTADADGRLAFPLELALVRDNPALRLTAEAEHPQLAYHGTMHLSCDEGGDAPPATRRALGPRDYAALPAADAGPDRVYALDDAVTTAQRERMAAHLARLRTAYVEVTGWAPPPMAVLLASADTRRLAPTRDGDDRRVWALHVDDLDDRAHATALLAHEWTHGALAEHASGSGAGDPAVRWLEDGLCDLVAAAVERRLYPDDAPVTTTGRAAELGDNDDDIPAQLSLVELAPSGGSLFGRLAALCDRGATYGYAYAYAFWLAADLDPDELRTLLQRLSESTILAEAQRLAPPGLTDLTLDRACALAILGGDRTCATESATLGNSPRSDP